MRPSVFSLSVLLGLFIPLVSSCQEDESSPITGDNDSGTVVDVDAAYFTSANENVTVTTVPCTLSDGTEIIAIKLWLVRLPTMRWDPGVRKIFLMAKRPEVSG